MLPLSCSPCLTETLTLCSTLNNIGDVNHPFNRVKSSPKCHVRHAAVQRWTFPFVPDTNLLPLSGNQGVSSYTMSLARLELTYR